MRLELPFSPLMEVGEDPFPDVVVGGLDVCEGPKFFPPQDWFPRWSLQRKEPAWFVGAQRQDIFTGFGTGPLFLLAIRCKPESAEEGHVPRDLESFVLSDFRSELEVNDCGFRTALRRLEACIIPIHNLRARFPKITIDRRSYNPPRRQE